MALEVEIIPVLNDNYIYLIHDEVTGETAAVDPAESGAVMHKLSEQSYNLTGILNTHHHWDHVGGNIDLKEKTGCTITGFLGDKERITGIDEYVEDGDSFRFGGEDVEVLFIPGHTSGHIAFYFQKSKMLFCGDTLFSMGCGRLFEGTAKQLHESLSKIAALPLDTRIYCGHEYTESNGRFALTLEPNNKELQKRMDEVRKLREKNIPTLPSTIELELQTNPFLRTESSAIRKHFNMLESNDVEVFTALRRLKDVA